MSYYADSGYSTLSRFEALQTPEQFKFYFHDDVFTAYDWTREPIESLQTIYRNRAQQIRDEYDHVILACSGGRDSTQVLESFFYNNIKIDEVLVVGATSQDPMLGSDKNHNGDLYHNILPLLARMNITPRFIDYSKLFDKPEQFTLVKQYGPDFFKEVNNCYYSPHNLFWYDLKRFIGASNDKRTAVVFGQDKPYFEYDAKTDRCYTEFNDISSSDYGGFSEDHNFKRVRFYTAQDTAQLISKQVHLVRRFFREQVGRTLSLERFNKNKWDIIVGLIYHPKQPLVHNSWKSKTGLISLRDTFILDHPESEIYKFMAETIKRIRRDLPPSKIAIPRFTTKRYYLEA